jgi:hypothetical protein
MFRLDHEVSKWCSALTRQGNFSASQVEELKDHLYNDVQEQQALGVSEETAFYLAVKKLGAVDDLAQEYAKNQRIGHALSAIANVTYGAQILGCYLVTVACLMCYSTAAAYLAYYSGQLTSQDKLPFVFAFAVVATFGWCGFKGVELVRGRVLSYGALWGLLTLILIQVPIIGGLPVNGYEFSGGLQYAVLLGPAEYRFLFNPGADVHINTVFSEPYFGINIVALVAGIFLGLKLIDKWRKDRGEVAHTTTAA